MATPAHLASHSNRVLSVLFLSEIQGLVNLESFGIKRGLFETAVPR